MSRKDLLDILNAVEVKSEVGIVRAGGHILLVVMNEDDVMRL